MERFFYFTTSGTTKKKGDADKAFKYSKERYFSFIEDILIPETYIEKNDTVLGLTTISGNRHIHGSNIQSMCRILKLKFYRNTKDYILFKNLINDGKISYLFCTPSFIFETKDFINFKKIKKIQLVGENITDNMKDFLLNKIFDSRQIITNNYGSTETNSIGYKFLGEDYFKLIKNSRFEIKDQDTFFYSPYICNDIDKFLLQDDILIKDDKYFNVIGRKSGAEYIKKGGKKILLDELKKYLYDKYHNIFLIKTNIINSNDLFFEDFEMIILKEKDTALKEDDIKKQILKQFYFEYLPIKIEIKDQIKKPNQNSFKSSYV
jgi:hypothetical protein